MAPESACQLQEIEQGADVLVKVADGVIADIAPQPEPLSVGGARR